MPSSGSPSADPFFPPTAWTLLLAATDPAAPETQAAREELCRAYWQPVARYLSALGLSPQDAEDGAQEMMATLFGKDGLHVIDRQRGRLRHYLKSCARHYMLNLRRDAAAEKRGGGAPVLALDEVTAEDQAAREATSDSVFDKAWAHALCDRAMRALEDSYARRGKADLLAALKPALVSDEGVQRYAEIGSLFRVTEAQIRIEVHRMRRRLGELLRAEVAATLTANASSAEIAEETRYLVRTLAYESRE